MIRLKTKLLHAQKEINESRKITYRTMAQESGISYQTVSRTMTGASETIALKTLDALCKYFDCGVGDLLEYVPGGGE